MKRKKLYKELNLVQVSVKELCIKLDYLAMRLNEITEFQGKRLAVWTKVESIVEAMTDQPSRDTVYEKEDDYELVPVHGLFISGEARMPRSILTSRYRDRNKKPVPLPAFAVGIFNRWAKEHPVRLRVWMDGDRIEPELDPLTEAEYAFCLLWGFYFRGDGWKRLKRCPVCKKWYVDDTANLKKERCSKTCTDKWWSRKWRSQTKAKFQRCPKCKKRFFLEHMVKGSLRKRRECPKCGRPIEPRKMVSPLPHGRKSDS